MQAGYGDALPAVTKAAIKGIEIAIEISGERPVEQANSPVYQAGMIAQGTRTVEETEELGVVGVQIKH